ncbi:MAG: hypothetical protein LBD24_03200, partial [Spirochaetaceae bacterium]|nr:hypothetical protein [Spirochaetaceae bacterium]
RLVNDLPPPATAHNNAQTVGDGAGDGAKRSRAYAATSPLTGHGVAPLRNNSAETVGDGPRLVRASPLTGQGVAPFGNNRRPCLEQPEAARSVAAPGLCKPAQRTRCCTIRKQQCLKPSETGRRLGGYFSAGLWHTYGYV